MLCAQDPQLWFSSGSGSVVHWTCVSWKIAWPALLVMPSATSSQSSRYWQHLCAWRHAIFRTWRFSLWPPSQIHLSLSKVCCRLDWSLYYVCMLVKLMVVGEWWCIFCTAMCMRVFQEWMRSLIWSTFHSLWSDFFLLPASFHSKLLSSDTSLVFVSMYVRVLVFSPLFGCGPDTGNWQIQELNGSDFVSREVFLLKLNSPDTILSRWLGSKHQLTYFESGNGKRFHGARSRE